VTLVPELKFAEQVPGQLIPAGWLVTVPVPDIETVNWTGAAVNVAETDCWPLATSWQEVPLHAPLKPAKLKPDPGVPVRETEVPDGKLAVQVGGQFTAAGLLVTVPVPVTATVNCACCGGCVVVLLELPPHAINAIVKERTMATIAALVGHTIHSALPWPLSCAPEYVGCLPRLPICSDPRDRALASADGKQSFTR